MNSIPNSEAQKPQPIQNPERELRRRNLKTWLSTLLCRAFQPEYPSRVWITSLPTAPVSSAELRWGVLVALMAVCVLTKFEAKAGEGDFRLLAGTGSSGTHPYSLVELQTDPVAELTVITGTFYMPTLDTAPSGQLYGAYTNLYLIDLTNSTVTSIGTFHTATDSSMAAVGMAFAPDGTLYAVFDNALYTVDTATCLATEVGPTTGGFVYGVDFAPDGRLFGGAMSLYQLDPGTGLVLTNLGSLPSLTVDIDFAADGFIYGVTYSGSKLHRINPDTAESELVGTYESSLRGVASAPLPEIELLLAECLDATNLTWHTGGDANWFGQTTTCHDGSDAAQSGAITNDQTTWVQTAVQGPGILTFYWKVSCDGGDELEFVLDDVAQNSINYRVDWRQERYLLPSGSHTLRWSYSKDERDSGSYYDYAGWLDEVVFTHTTSPVFYEPPHDRTALWGESVSLEMILSGTEPFSYQWRSNSVDVPGQTNAAYFLDFARTDDNALYSVVVTNSYGAATSAPVRLQVLNLKMDWQRTLGGSKTDNARGIEALPDGNCLVGGWSSSSDGTKISTNWGLIDFSLTCLDPAGEPVWDRSFGGVADDAMYGSFCIATNGDYVMAGVSVTPLSGPAGGNKTSANYGGYDAWTVRCDSTGNKVSGWDVTIGGTEDDRFQAVRQTSDGGFILAGYSESPTSGNKTGTNYGWDDYLVVRLASDGTCLWDRSLGGANFDYASDVWQTSDGGFLVAGDSDSPPGGSKTSTNYNRSRDVWLVKLDGDGNQIWDKTYGGDGSDWLYCGSPTLDNGWIFAASSNSETNESKTAPLLGGSDWWVVRLDADGNIVWQRTFGGTAGETPGGITPTSDGGFLIVGSSNSGFGVEKTSSNHGSSDGWLVRLDADGNRLWDYSFGGEANDSLYAVRETPDGGLVLAGSSWSDIGGNKSSPNFGGADIWVIKLAPALVAPASFSLSAAWTNGNCVVRLLGTELGQSYLLQRSDDLVRWQDWETVANTGGVVQCLDPSVGAEPCRFYRAILQP